MDTDEITRDNLMDILLNSDQRAELRKSLRRDQNTHCLHLQTHLEKVQRSCKATPEQLQILVDSVLGESGRNLIKVDVLGGLIFHPAMPDDPLLLYERRRYITELDHRGGSRKLCKMAIRRAKLSPRSP